MKRGQIIAVVVTSLAVLYLSPSQVALREESQQHSFAIFLMANVSGEFRKRLIKLYDSHKEEWDKNPEKRDADLKLAEKGVVDYSIKELNEQSDKTSLRDWGMRAWLQDVNGMPTVFVTFARPRFNSCHKSLNPVGSSDQ